MAMLTGYFDESGIHKGDHLCVVAGWVGNEAQWHALAAHWIKALGRRKNLHMKKLRWKHHPDATKKLLATLGALPERYNLVPVYGGIWQRDYESIVKGKVKATFTTPYMLAAQLCMTAALRGVSSSERIGFVFDKQTVYADPMRRMEKIISLCENDNPRFQGISSISRTCTVCLDPADYLAYQIREFNQDKNSLRTKLGMPIFGKDGGKGFGIGRIHGPQDLQNFVNLLTSQGFGVEATGK
jgi:hypothetical protein